jgi:hypothetical protein
MPESQKTVSTDLFVATDLDAQQLGGKASDIVHGGKIYRRLSPDYFAWLRSRMQTAQAAFRNKQLLPAKWNALRQRFNFIQEQAIALFGKRALKMACENLDVSQYMPPKIQRTETAQRWLYPKNETLPFAADVDSCAVAKVDAIRIQAMDLGWTEAQLYQNQGRLRFPCGEHYGLICFVRGDRNISGMTESYIEIIHGAGTSREHVLKFHNSKVSQPWMKNMEATNGN